jgi:hypothetical protein
MIFILTNSLSIILSIIKEFIKPIIILIIVAFALFELGIIQIPSYFDLIPFLN